MNFMKGSLFHRSTEPEEVEIIEESGGGVLAVWGSPGCGKTVTAVKIAKHLASQKKNVALLLCDMTAPASARPLSWSATNPWAASSPPSESP